jgi:hypothetical protein
LRSDDMGAGIEGKDVPDERLAFSLPCDHVGDLDDGIDVRFREDTLSTGTLDIETEDSEGCDIRSITFRRVRDEFVVAGRPGHSAST